MKIHVYQYSFITQECMAFFLHRTLLKDAAKRKEEKEKEPIDAPKKHKLSLPFDRFADLVKFNADLEPTEKPNKDLVQTETMLDMVSLQNWAIIIWLWFLM